MNRSSRRLAIGVVAFAALAASAGTASAHVRYVVDDPADVASIVTFVASTLADPVNAVLLGGGAFAVVGGVLAYRRYRPFQADVAVFRAAMADYRDLLPWLLRLSVGLPLVGAGFSGYYFTPLVASDARVLFVGLGFLLLFGLATRAVAVLALLVYLLGLATHPALLLQFEYVGGLLALVLLGGGRPSADDVLGRVAAADDTFYGRIDPINAVAGRVREHVDPFREYAPFVIRVSLAGAFVYLGLVEKLLNPGYALAVVAKYDLTAVVPVAPELWVVGAAFAEIAVGVVLAFGLYTRGAALLSLGLFVLTLFGLPDDPVLAHVSLFGLASALLVTGAGPLSLDARFAAGTESDDCDSADDGKREEDDEQVVVNA
jgi:uncharacterized membrane protein YphA (DoxX/SURF4 family)